MALPLARENYHDVKALFEDLFTMIVQQRDKELPGYEKPLTKLLDTSVAALAESDTSANKAFWDFLRENSMLGRCALQRKREREARLTEAEAAAPKKRARK